MPTTQNKDYYAHARREEDGHGGGDSQGLPQGGAAISPRREPRRQAGRGEVQGDLRGQRRSERREEAQGLRPGGLLLRPDRPGAGRGLCAAERGGGRPAGGLWRLRFLRLPERAGASGPAGGARVRRRGAASRTFFRASFPGRSSRSGRADRSRAPISNTRPRWTSGRRSAAARRGIQVHRQEICPTCHGQAHTGGPMQCPECNGTGQVTQMGGRMKFNIPCPRCNGTGKTSNDCPTCHGEGVVSRAEPVEFRIKAGHARRPAHPPAGQGQRRAERRARRATCL